MSSPFGPLRLIVNPRAGRAVARTLGKVAEHLGAAGLAFDIAHTSGPGDATRLARRALEEDVRFLVAVGGDGTCHEVVNGMFDVPSPSQLAAGAMPVPVSPDAVLGVVAAGSGCDLVRTFGLPAGARAAHHLGGPATRLIDVGVASYLAFDGEPAARVFLNIAEVGYGAEVARRASGYPRRLGRFRYLVGAYGALRTLRREDAVVRVGDSEKSVPLVDLVVANGRFFGGGMKVAPRAEPDDGNLDVQVFTGHRAQVILLTPKIYGGRHLPHRDILEYTAPRVAIAPKAPLLVEADGEVIGLAPANFTVVPRALRLKI